MKSYFCRLVQFFACQNKSMSSLDKLPDHEKYILDILLYCAVGSVLPKDRNNASATVGGIVPCAPGQKGVPLVVPVLLSTLEGISHIRIFMPKDIRSESARETLWKSVQEVHRRFPDGIALLDPIENMDIKDEKFKTLVNVSLNAYLMLVADERLRGSMSWRRRCSRVHCTKILDCPSCIQCTGANKKANRKSGL